MLSFFTYPNKVQSALFRLGWTPESLPSVSNTWLQLIHALRKKGITAERAALELDQALQGDLDSLEWVTANTGLWGTMFFGTEKQWVANQHMFFEKPTHR